MRKLFEPNVKLKAPVKVSNWRKSAVGTYSMTGDCQVYCIQSINIAPALEFILKRGGKFTLTHLVGKACGGMIKKYPEVNRLLKFGRFYPREEISIFFQVAMDQEGKDLSGHTIRNIDAKSLSQIKEDMNKALTRMKKGDDFHYKKAKKTLGRFPAFFLKPLLSLYGFILYGLNLWTPFIGAPKDAFGSMMVTNIGNLGMQTGLVPLVAYSRCPLILAFGAVYDKVVALDGKPCVQKTVDCGWTLDHRMIDGVVGANMSKEFQRLMENPDLLEF